MKKIHNIKIEPLTAVHIGTGETLTPLDYVVIEVKRKNAESKDMYMKFSSDNMLSRLMDDKDKRDALRKFEAASVSGDIRELQKFFHTNFTSDDLDYPCDVTEEFLHIYKSKTSENPVDNALEVLQMYRPAGSKNPVIPGSSIKGAIRTALLNCSLGDIKKESDIRRLEKNIFKFENEKDDPLRALSISDAFFESKNSPYVGVLKNVSFNKSKNELKEIGIQIIAEMIFGNLLKVPTSSTIRVSIDEDLQGSSIKSNNPKNSFEMKKKFNIENIINDCNTFFAKTFDKEYDTFYDSCAEGIDVIDQLKNQIDEIYESENSFPLRLGRWSQVEFVTLKEPFRKPNAKKGHGGTRTLLDYNGNFVPMGWCKCTVLK